MPLLPQTCILKYHILKVERFREKTQAYPFFMKKMHLPCAHTNVYTV